MSAELERLNAEVLACRLCPRLVEWRERVAREKRKAYAGQEYWGKPVPGFGDPQARVFVVGLAPGAHGSNRTGRQFTGDASGNFLYPALYRAGFASQQLSVSRGDGLSLSDLYTAPVCRCAPPDNRPAAAEMANCQPFLEGELRLMQPRVVVALGRIAFESVLRMLSGNLPEGVALPAGLKFGHGLAYLLPASALIHSPFHLVCSYHPSQQNTLTGRLTVEMFDNVWVTVRQLLEEA